MTLRTLCIHGLGRQKPDWSDGWAAALHEALGRDRAELDFLYYDPLYEEHPNAFGDTLEAAWRLTAGGAFGRRRTERGLIDSAADALKWKAGYVVAWCANQDFQAATRAMIVERISAFRPDVILAHSLGSLLTYDALRHADAARPEVARALRSATLVTFGSQLANDFVLNHFGGRLRPLPVRFWHNLYNPKDPVFVKSFGGFKADPAYNFLQTTVISPPEHGDPHGVGAYLRSDEAREAVWRPLLAGPDAARALPVPRALRPRAPRRRALLVGVDAYADKAANLSGAVNDVFSMSAALQERGFEPDDIRACLDDRATAEGVTERLRWLLDDARPDDRLVFHYSGHGVRLPVYGPDGTPDRYVEALAPHDFDWTPERAITDSAILELYAELPYGVRFLMTLDCCHAGGVHRDGGPRVRGLTPPDDLRHRALRWNARERMWEERPYDPLVDGFAATPAEEIAWLGRDRATERLGRAARLRGLSDVDYRAVKATEPEPGPYLPVVLEACTAGERAFEYRHGAESHGAFTWCLTQALRGRGRPDFARLVSGVRAKLRRLGYDQTPAALGPAERLAEPAFWDG